MAEPDSDAQAALQRLQQPAAWSDVAGLESAAQALHASQTALDAAVVLSALQAGLQHLASTSRQLRSGAAAGGRLGQLHASMTACRELSSKLKASLPSAIESHPDLVEGLLATLSSSCTAMAAAVQQAGPGQQGGVPRFGLAALLLQAWEAVASSWGYRPGLVSSAGLRTSLAPVADLAMATLHLCCSSSSSSSSDSSGCSPQEAVAAVHNAAGSIAQRVSNEVVEDLPEPGEIHVRKLSVTDDMQQLLVVHTALLAAQLRSQHGGWPAPAAAAAITAAVAGGSWKLKQWAEPPDHVKLLEAFGLQRLAAMAPPAEEDIGSSMQLTDAGRAVVRLLCFRNKPLSDEGGDAGTGTDSDSDSNDGSDSDGGSSSGGSSDGDVLPRLTWVQPSGKESASQLLLLVFIELMLLQPDFFTFESLCTHVPQLLDLFFSFELRLIAATARRSAAEQAQLSQARMSQLAAGWPAYGLTLSLFGGGYSSQAVAEVAESTTRAVSRITMQTFMPALLELVLQQLGPVMLAAAKASDDVSSSDLADYYAEYGACLRMLLLTAEPEAIVEVMSELQPGTALHLLETAAVRPDDLFDGEDDLPARFVRDIHGRSSASPAALFAGLVGRLARKLMTAQASARRSEWATAVGTARLAQQAVQLLVACQKHARAVAVNDADCWQVLELARHSIEAAQELHKRCSKAAGSAASAAGPGNSASAAAQLAILLLAARSLGAVAEVLLRPRLEPDGHPGHYGAVDGVSESEEKGASELISSLGRGVSWLAQGLASRLPGLLQAQLAAADASPAGCSSSAAPATATASSSSSSSAAAGPVRLQLAAAEAQAQQLAAKGRSLADRLDDAAAECEAGGWGAVTFADLINGARQFLVSDKADWREDELQACPASGKAIAHHLAAFATAAAALLPVHGICNNPGCSNNLAGLPGQGAKHCTGCRAAAYCGTDCQKQHWRQHKVICGGAGGGKGGSGKKGKAAR